MKAESVETGRLLTALQRTRPLSCCSAVLNPQIMQANNLHLFAQADRMFLSTASFCLKQNNKIIIFAGEWRLIISTEHVQSKLNLMSLHTQLSVSMLVRRCCSLQG